MWVQVAEAPWLIISDAGEVRSEHLDWQEVGFSKRGYRLVNIHRKQVFIHRLVALAFIGPQPEGKPLVRHLNGDPFDNRVENLSWGDGVENMADARRHGTLRTGPAHHNWKDVCRNGHDLTGQNVYVTGGRRRCRPCERAAVSRYRKRNPRRLAAVL